MHTLITKYKIDYRFELTQKRSCTKRRIKKLHLKHSSVTFLHGSMSKNKHNLNPSVRQVLHRQLPDRKSRGNASESNCYGARSFDGP